eukprot:TRINITY_DN21615_c0_g1_i1.p1 TRINITY_DN21615_c0_g1~~TRINITY_DN21615_c0_g1_i1.p1  ORF type:complete len:680 (-),score=179.56 TRINITY_DN21615_c0_g1_i1:170-2209(-)
MTLPFGRYSAKADDYRLPARHREAAALLSVAQGHCIEGDPAAAFQAAVDSMEMFAEVGDCRGAANARQIASIELAKLGRLEDAEQLIEQGLEMFRTIGDTSAEATMLLALFNIRRLASPCHSQALRLGMEALALCQATGDRHLEATVHLHLSDLYSANPFSSFPSSSRSPQKGLEAANKAVELFREENDKHGVGAALQAAAASIFAGAGSGPPGEWQKKASEARALFKETGDQWLEASTLLKTARMHLAVGQAKPAVSCAEQAMEIYQALGVSEVDALECFVDANLKLGEAKRAVDVAKELLGTRQRSGDKKGEALIQEILIGALAALAGRRESLIEEASTAARDGASIYREFGNFKAECRVLRSASSMHCQKKQFDKAMNLAQEALASARDSEDKISAVEVFSDACLAAGKPEKAAKLAEQLSSGQAQDRHFEAKTSLIAAAAYLESKAPSRCVDLARKAHALADEAGLVKVQAKALLLIAKAGVAQNKSTAALLAAQRAQRLFKQDLDSLGEASAMLEVGRAKLMQLTGNALEPTPLAWNSAIESLEEALGIAEGIANESLSATAKDLLANAKLKRKGETFSTSVTKLDLVTRSSELQLSSEEGPGRTTAEGPSELVRVAGAGLADSRSGLIFKVQPRLDGCGKPASIVDRYYKQAMAELTIPVMQSGTFTNHSFFH